MLQSGMLRRDWENDMGGYSVECDCGKWFTQKNAYKDHCKAKGCIHHLNRVGPKPKIKT